MAALDGVFVLLLFSFQIVSHALAHILGLCTVEGHLSLQLTDKAIALSLPSLVKLFELTRPLCLALDVSALQALVVRLESV